MGLGGLDSFGQDLGNSIIGNVPKAILCVRKFTGTTNKMPMNEGKQGMLEGSNAVSNLQTQMMKKIGSALNGKPNVSAASTLSDFAEGGEDAILTKAGFVGLEVQYNPNSIHFDSQAGRQVSYSGGTMGSAANNQVVQVIQPVSTTMTLQLIFDDVNVYDSFMLTDMMPTVGNAVTAGADIANKVRGKKYSVQAQVDGLLSLLVADETRQVLFFWSKMCFGGEVTSVNTSYTMFNTSGNPVRGVVNLSIRQGQDEGNKYDEQYWGKAFDTVFGTALENKVTGNASKFSQITQNNVLNLNI